MLKISTITNFRKNLKNEKNINFPLLFFGPEIFLIKDTIDKICTLKDVKKKTYFLSEVSLEDIINSASSLSLFEKEIIYVVYEFELLLSNLEKLKQNLNFFKNNLIFISQEEIIPTKLLFSYFKGQDISKYLSKDVLEVLKNFEIIYSSKMKKDKLRSLVIQKFSKHSISLEKDALETLLNLVNDLQSLKLETDKLVLYALETNKKIIKKEDVQLLCVGFEFNFWDTINLFLEGNYDKFIEYLEKAYRENMYLSIPMFLGRLKNIIKGKTSYDKMIFSKYPKQVLLLYKYFIDLDINLRKNSNIKSLSQQLLISVLNNIKI